MTSGLIIPISFHHRSPATLIAFSFVVAGVSWRLLRGSKGWSMAKLPESQGRRHPVYWFDDGSVIVRAYNEVVLERELENGWDVPIMTIPPVLGVQVQDFTSLLAHLYHDSPLSQEAPFHHVAAVLRVSSPEQLNLPAVHSLARSYLVAMFHSGPSPFVHPNHLEEALNLALRYNINSIQKGIYYSLVTTTEFEPGVDATHDEAADAVSSVSMALAPTDVARCRNLMSSIVEHFTPVLFEPPVTPHLACTGLLGDKWFPLVIQSAIAGDSVYKPLEALEQLKQIDWVAEGLCTACVREKREEWTNEQREVWEKMDEWLELDVVSE